MPSLRHTHTYVKYKKRPGYWRCADPHCTHILDSEAVFGKASLCTMCGAEMILNREDMKRTRPRCVACSNTKRGRAFRASQNFLHEFLPSLEAQKDFEK